AHDTHHTHAAGDHATANANAGTEPDDRHDHDWHRWPHLAVERDDRTRRPRHDDQQPQPRARYVVGSASRTHAVPGDQPDWIPDNRSVDDVSALEHGAAT